MKQFFQWSTRRYVAIVLTLVAVFGLIQAWRVSPTMDEHIHTASAYLALTRGDHRFDPEHPFTFKYLTALPLLLIQPNMPPRDKELWDASLPSFMDSWQEARTWSNDWLYVSGNNPEVMMFLARIPGVIALVLLAYLVFIASREWFGEYTARWALFFVATTPSLLGHGPFTNTDIPVTLAIMFTLWRFWKYFQKPSWKEACWIALALGLALTTKFSAVILVPIGIFWLIYTSIKQQTRFWVALGHFALITVGIWALIWISYFGKTPLYLTGAPDNYILAAVRQAVAARGITLEDAATFLHYILPSAYLKGLFLSLGGSYFGRPSFVLGAIHSIGVWYYFPALFLLKTQLTNLILLGLGLGLFFKKMINVRSWQPLHWLIGATVLIILYTSVTSKLNLGIRHISQIMPFVAIALALTMAKIKPILRSSFWPAVIVFTVVAPVVLQSGNMIGFSNSLIFPQTESYKYFNDSNLDWGQQSKGVAQYILAKYPGEKIYSNYPWSPYALEYYGVERSPFDPTNPPSDGVIYVTATEMIQPSFHEIVTDFRLDSTYQNNGYFFK